MTSLNDWFAQLSETRLQQSLDRLNTTDSRALGLLGFVAVLMAGLWAVYLATPGNKPAGAIALSCWL